MVDKSPAPVLPTMAQMLRSLGSATLPAVRKGVLEQASEAQLNVRLTGAAQAAISVVMTTASFVFSESGSLIGTDWIDFGKVAFLSEPCFLQGMVWVPQNGEPLVGEDGTGFSFTTHEVWPVVAVQFRYETDPEGRYRRAKLLALGIGELPSGYRAKITCAWIGQAVRVG